MFFDLSVGSLIDPIAARRWDPAAIQRQLAFRMRHFREHGVARGDRVFLHHGNTLEFFVDLLAVWRLGACAVPIDPRLTPYEVDALARAARPRCAVWRGVDRSPREALTALGVAVLDSPADGALGGAERGSPLDAGSSALDDDALVLFTSGTMGAPKGVVHTHRSLRARWTALQLRLGTSAFRRSLCLLPTHFGHGLICNALYPWLSGQDLILLPPFRSDVLVRLGSIIDDHEVTFLSSVPSLWHVALRASRSPRGGSLVRVFCGSAPLSARLWADVQEWAGTRDVANAYGTTETGSWLAGATAADGPPEDGLVGEAWGGVVKVLRTASTDPGPLLAEECAPGERGYVWVNTPALMRGYLDAEDATRRAVSHGWFSTADTGFRDERGRLYLTGRESEEINRAGTKIHPAEIDAVVERFAHTVDVCAFGYGDPIMGESVGIAVVLDRDQPEIRRGLYDWTRRYLAAHRVPQRWYVLDSIPRNANGKADRAGVARHCAELPALDMRGT